MSPAPDFYVQTINVQDTYDALLATDQWFIVGLTEKGPLTPTRHTTFETWEATFGGSVAFSQMREEARLYFAEGGRNLVTQRVIGPAPVYAFSSVNNTAGSPAPTIKFVATSYGTYANTITRQVIAGGTTGVVVKIVDENGDLFTSPELLTVQAIVDYYADGATGVKVEARGGGGLPATGAAIALATGTDDHASATDANYATALGLLDIRLGPGQVSMPGRTTDAARVQLRAHKEQYDRVAIADLADSGDPSTLAGAISDEHDDTDGSDGMGIFVPWVVDPDGGQLPPSGFVAAKCARIDLATGNPNLAAAGDRGQAFWIEGLTQDFTDTQRAALAAASINPIHDVDLQGTLQVYDFVTINQDDPLGTSLGNARLDMRLRWHARKVARPLLFEEIDAFGHLASRYNGLLDGMLKTYKDLGAVYDYIVDTDSVNTPETAQADELNARIGIQRSRFARFIYLTVNNYKVTADLTEVAA